MRNVAINTIQRKGNSIWIHYGTGNKCTIKNMGTSVGLRTLSKLPFFKKDSPFYNFGQLRYWNGTHTITKCTFIMSTVTPEVSKQVLEEIKQNPVSNKPQPQSG